MPGSDGTPRPRGSPPGARARVLVLTTYDTDGDILRAVEAGATGYLLKDTPRDELTDAVRAAARGETVLAPPIAARLMRRRATGAASPTAREVEVLRAVARGRTNAQIGRGSPSARRPSRHTCCGPSPSSGSTTAPMP